MEIIWTPQADKDFQNTLDFWDEYTGSPLYSNKIETEIINLLKEISNPNALYYGRYSKNLNLYVRGILKNRFLIYFDVDEENSKIEIVHFRSSQQQSLELL